MRDEELEVLITLDDPWYGPDEDIFNHHQPGTYRAAVSNGGHRNVINDSPHQENYNEMLFASI